MQKKQQNELLGEHVYTNLPSKNSGPLRHINVNKVQPIRVKMLCIAAIRVTCTKDFVSVVKILLKAFFLCSLFPYPPPPHNPRSMHLIV
jgi:hypothetical protein